MTMGTPHQTNRSRHPKSDGSASLLACFGLRPGFAFAAGPADPPSGRGFVNGVGSMA